MDIQWSLLLFSLLAGTGGSLLAYVGLSQFCGFGARSRRNLIIASLVLVVVGGLFSVLHLEQKANIMAAAANVFSFSPISIELIMVGLNVIVGIVYLVMVIKETGELSLKVVAALGILFGLLIGYATGSGYQMGAQPMWNTVLLPLCYLVTDLALAGAVYVLVLWASKNRKAANADATDEAKDGAKDDDKAAKAEAEGTVEKVTVTETVEKTADGEKVEVVKTVEEGVKASDAKADDADAGVCKLPLAISFGCSVASLVLCLVYGLVTMFGGQPVLFWLGVIVLGSLCNAICSFLLFKKKVEPALLGLNVAFALCAGVCLRAFMWLIGTGTLDLFAMAQAHVHF